MRVYLGSDHAGFELKARLVGRLGELGHEPVDCGPAAYDEADDYPPHVLLAATRVAADPGSLGVVLGGSGNGEAIAANKVPGIRCAVAFSRDTARLAREHNDANVLSLGARMYPADEAVGYVETFLATPFSHGDRHLRRIAQITGYERTGELPAGSPPR
ncbi:MAG TPA: ribose-5-phosphate isomerase [Mycobacteriales bacterium]|nr:ribose-5-phosphate isomerase [Mycobacteriales bacterium]